MNRLNWFYRTNKAGSITQCWSNLYPIVKRLFPGSHVIFTSGSPKKLQRYQALGIPEVCFWQDGIFSLYHLREDSYEAIAQSEILELKDLDIDLLTRCVLIAQTSRLEAANTFRNALKNSSKNKS